MFFFTAQLAIAGTGPFFFSNVQQQRTLNLQSRPIQKNLNLNKPSFVK